MPTALITGVAGQDGSYLAEFLLQRDYRVVGTTRDARRTLELPYARALAGVELLEGDGSRVEDWTEILRRERPDEVYHLVKSMVENYEHYEGTTPDTKQFAFDAVLKEPLVVPFHEGTVRYFEERGVWTEELERKNDELIERGERMREAWPGVVESSSSAEELEQNWTDWKTDELDGEETDDAN